MAAESHVFQSTGRKVSQRLFLISAMRWLNRSIWIVALLILVVAVLLRLTGNSTPQLEWGVLGGSLVLWTAAVLIIRNVLKPAPFQALAAWEEMAGGKSVLSSAEFFESLENPTQGERMHLEHAARIRDERLKSLSKDLPIPKPHWSWLLVIPVAALLLTPAFKPVLSSEDQVITEDMKTRAEEEARKLTEEKTALKDLDSLTDDEKKEVEKLSAMLEETSEFLSDAGSKTSRELLEELEARARDAERMANKLGADEDAWASEEMLEEMSQHADTADLADAIREKEADLSANESEKLAEKLQDEAITTEVKTRLGTALDRTMGKATEEDKDKPVGEHVGNASGKLSKNQARPAGQEFRYLADHFRDLARRKRAQEKLEELADKLRESGNNIAQSQLEQMEQLGGQSGSAGQQQQPPPGAQNLAQTPPMMPQNMGNTPQMQQPGGQQQGMQQGQGMQQAPVPGMQMQQMPQGMNQQGQQMGAAQLGQGQQPGQQGQALMAPVPGQAPGSGNPAMMLGTAGSPMSAPGLQAGFGTAKMGTDATEAMKSNRDSMVDAQINQDGESVVRSVQGGVRSEEAQRQTQEQNAEFLAVEEQALDEKALPVSRKDQVLKYFTALREQFEESN